MAIYYDAQHAALPIARCERCLRDYAACNRCGHCERSPQQAGQPCPSCAGRGVQARLMRKVERFCCQRHHHHAGSSCDHCGAQG